MKCPNITFNQYMMLDGMVKVMGLIKRPPRTLEEAFSNTNYISYEHQFYKSRTLASLLKRGLVERVIGKINDPRHNEIVPTEAGRKLRREYIQWLRPIRG